MSEWDEFDFEDNKNSDNNSGLRQFLFKLLANWYWFVISGIVGLLIAFVYLRYSTPIYQISAKVLVSDEKKGAGMMEGSMLGDLSGMLGAKSTVDNEVEILKTRDLMEQVVRSLDANITYYRKGSIRDVEIFEAPFKLEIIEDNIRSEQSFSVTPKNSGGLLINGDDLNVVVNFNEIVKLPGIGIVKFSQNELIPFEFETFSVTISSVDQTVGSFMEGLSVEVSNKLVTVVDLGFSYPVKEKGEYILRTLINHYVQGNLNDKNAIADSTIDFIEERLMLVSQELGDVEGNIQTFKQQSQLADISTQSQLLLENTSKYYKELADVETQLNIASSMEEFLSDAKNIRILPSAMIPNDIIFTGLVDRYNALLLERDRKLLSSTPDNPTIINLGQQIENLRFDIQSNLLSTKDKLIISRNNLLKKIQEMAGQIRTVPATERTYLDLTRQQQVKQALYVFLLQKREETAISKTSNISNSRVIDKPKASNSPISPKKLLVWTIGLLAGLGIPFLVIYFKDLLNVTIYNKEDITRRTQVPIIAEIRHNDSRDEIISKNSRTAISENFRSLRTNLSFYLKQKKQKVILLTSGVSGEGKSFTALNLALIIAFSGKKVVLMEMDLRKPKISSRLDIKDKLGFSNYIISENVSAEQIITPSKIEQNLFLLSSGPIPPNPSELILNSRMDELMVKLKGEFDYIIIDAPPIGLVTDAQLLSKYSDLSLFIIRQGFTHKNQLDLINDLHFGNKLGKLAMIVNDIKHKGGYGYNYGYGYGYGYGYYEEGDGVNRK